MMTGQRTVRHSQPLPDRPPRRFLPR
jgi:hypothetical protein